jgi:hypothetical protein
MLRKTQQLTVSHRRPATSFFNRLQEVFERKFDGFPAAVDDASGTPTLDEWLGGEGPELDIGDYLEGAIPQCPDAQDCEETQTGSGCVETFTRSIPSGNTWGQSEITGRNGETLFWGTQSHGDLAVVDGRGSFVNPIAGTRYSGLGLIGVQYPLEITGEVSYESSSGGIEVWFHPYAPNTDSVVKILWSSTTMFGSRLDYDAQNWVTPGDQLTGQIGFSGKSGGFRVRFTNANTFIAAGTHVPGALWDAVIPAAPYPIGQITVSAVGAAWIDNIRIVSGLGCGTTNNCSGKSYTETLTSVSVTSSGIVSWKPSFPVAYYVEVWKDGLPVVKDEEYKVTSDGYIVFVGGSSVTDNVVARYVVA